MASPIRVSFGTVVLAIRQQIIDFGVLPTDQVHIVTRRIIPHSMGQWDVLIRPGALYSDLSVIASGGRFDTRVRRRLHVTVRTRLALDQTSDDIDWLLDLAEGHIPHEEAVNDAIHGLFPTDNAHNVLTYEPVKLLAASEPDPDHSDASWGQSVLDYDVPYIMALDQAREPFG